MKRMFAILTAVVMCGLIALFFTMRPIAPRHGGLAEQTLPQLIPLRDFFADAQAQWRHKISPDGRKIAWLEAKYLRPALWVKRLDGADVEIFHTSDTVRWYQWSADSRYLLYQADRDGWENDVVVSVDTEAAGAKARSYDFGADVKSFIHQVPKGGGDEIIVAHNGRDRAQFDLYRLNLSSGKTEPLSAQLERDISWQSDENGDIWARRVGVGANWTFEVKDGANWRVLVRGGLEDVLWITGNPQPEGWVYAMSGIGRDKTALVKLDLVTGAEEVVYGRNDVDVSYTLMDRENNRPLMAVSYPGYQHREVFDGGFGDVIDGLDKDAVAAVHLTSHTADFSKMLFDIEMPDASGSLVLVDRVAGTQEVLSRPQLSKYEGAIGQMEPVFIPARDGLTIPAYLTRPVGVTGPVPMIVIVHGGPVARVHWGWNDFVAVFSNRGYAVLDVNYRGSAGYGRAFREAAKDAVSREMHWDVMDARQWAIDEGIADPDAIGIFGGSFGGLKTFTAMTQDPDLFQAGVSINGISDLTTMLQEVPVYWRGWPDWHRAYLGDPAKPEDMADIADRSPVNHAAKVTGGMLIVQGTNDVRVIQDQSDKMAAALDEAGVPYEYEIIEGAGHQLRNWTWQQRLLFARRVERFFAKHLGGRAQGFDYAVVGAYIIP